MMQIEVVSILIGIITIIIAFFLAVKKKIHLLRGYNHQRMSQRNKQKLINLISSCNLICGTILILVPIMLPWWWTMNAIYFVLFANVSILIYSNIVLVDKK
ncbi:hypothetical protein [Terribacillus sp. 7520-G]|uniref:DUF3784 domain-containing protein n=1 Tax=Terribacillus TaxID=459532 RepID=UPI00117F2138|nr:hypothetical protein [Terribacillus sp. 7520-G]